MTLRVLLVEDLRDTHPLLSDLFAAPGEAQIVGVETTEPEARAWLAQHAGEWDVAIVDLILAEGSGMGVVRRAREVSVPGKIAGVQWIRQPRGQRTLPEVRRRSGL
jgi:two-component system, OmpR family, response regulator